MKKTLIAVLGVIVLAGASAFATESRTTVMGENNMIMVDDGNIGLFPGRVNNYPNLALAEFGDQGFYNFGVTWQFNEKRPWVLGTFVSTEQLYPNEFYELGFGSWNIARFPSYGYLYGENGLLYDYPSRRMQLIYGRKLIGQNFGFAFESVRSSWELQADSGSVSNTGYYPYPTMSESINPKESMSQYKFTFGLTEATSGKWDVALSALFGSWTNKDPWGEKISEPSGYSDLKLAGRYFWVRNPKVTLVPHASIEMNKRGAKYVDVLRLYDSTEFDTAWDIEGDSALYAYWNDFANDDAKTEYKQTKFDLGMGLNYTPAPKMLAVADFGIRLESVKAKYTRGSDITDMIAFKEVIEHNEESYPDYGTEHDYFRNDIPYNYYYGYEYPTYQYLDGDEKSSYSVLPYLKLGFEGEVFSWMDIRLGGQTTLWSNKDKWTSDFAKERTTNFASSDTYFGFGFNWGKLYLDTESDPELLLRGFNFLTGDQSEGEGFNMNWRVSLLYEMF